MSDVKDFVQGLETINYDNLVLKINSSELVPGQKYLLEDYQTVHTIPNTTDTNTGPIEPLVLTALGNNNLEVIAYSNKITSTNYRTR